MKYRHLTENERYQIQALKAEGLGPTAIGKHIGRCKSVISRELGRNRHPRGYQAKQAHERYRKGLQDKGRAHQIWGIVFEELGVPLLAEGWSPEQISGVFRNTEYAVSHEWLYQKIRKDQRSGGGIFRHLRCQKKRRKRYGAPVHSGPIPNRRSISERPMEVEDRLRVGDWEADTIIGTAHQGVVISLVERKTGYTKLRRVLSKEAHVVAGAINDMLAPYEEHVLTITFDNGGEFALHEHIAKTLKADCFFADPYSSWQRGSNENTNGLVRQYFPKGQTNFKDVSDAAIAKVEDKLNNRPRKRLLFKSPSQVFL